MLKKSGLTVGIFDISTFSMVLLLFFASRNGYLSNDNEIYGKKIFLSSG